MSRSLFGKWFKAAARAAGIEVIPGNAASSDVLAHANVTDARGMVIAIPNAFEAGQAVERGTLLCRIEPVSESSP